MSELMSEDLIEAFTVPPELTEWVNELLVAMMEKLNDEIVND